MMELRPCGHHWRNNDFDCFQCVVAAKNAEWRNHYNGMITGFRDEIAALKSQLAEKGVVIDQLQNGLSVRDAQLAAKDDAPRSLVVEHDELHVALAAKDEEIRLLVDRLDKRG